MGDVTCHFASCRESGWNFGQFLKSPESRIFLLELVNIGVSKMGAKFLLKKINPYPEFWHVKVEIFCHSWLDSWLNRIELLGLIVHPQISFDLSARWGQRGYWWLYFFHVMYYLVWFSSNFQFQSQCILWLHKIQNDDSSSSPPFFTASHFTITASFFVECPNFPDILTIWYNCNQTTIPIALLFDFYIRLWYVILTIDFKAIL